MFALVPALPHTQQMPRELHPECEYGIGGERMEHDKWGGSPEGDRRRWEKVGGRK